LKVTSKGFDHGASPAEFLLLAVDGFPDVPVELEQLLVHRA
jgi:hypothetical protein